MKEFIRVMKALSDPNRVRILKLLQHQQELCVCELHPLIGLAQSTVSKHMKLLEEADLVHYYKQGSWIIYQLSDGEESVYAKTMLANLTDWLSDDPVLEKMLETVPKVIREPNCSQYTRLPL